MVVKDLSQQQRLDGTRPVRKNSFLFENGNISKEKADCKVAGCLRKGSAGIVASRKAQESCRRLKGVYRDTANIYQGLAMKQEKGGEPQRQSFSSI